MREQDLARIAFVTRRFGELQGLRSACFGAMLVAGAVTVTLVPGAEPVFFIAMPAQNVMFGLSIVLSGYYERWFGRVPGDRHVQSLARVPWDYGSGIALFVVVAGMSIDMLKSLWYPGGVSFGAAALVAYSGWIAYRDWPHRLHHVIGIFAGLAGVAVSSSMPVTHRVFGHPMDAAVSGVYALTYAILGLGLLAVGLLDHGLLAQAMRRHDTSVRRVAVDPSASRLRASVAAGCLLTTFGYLWLVGSPDEEFGLYLTLYVGLSLVAVTFAMVYLTVTRVREFRTAEGEPARRREAKLLAQMAHLRGEPSPSPEIDVSVSVPNVPPFDTLGHFVLPFAVASGALVDVASRGSGFPSLLGLALAASHLRIAVRDWPSRKHYLLGTLAATISTVHFMFVSGPRVFDWAVWFVILVCGAMVVEGLLDLRLSRETSAECARGTDAVAG